MGTPVATEYEGMLDAIRDWPSDKRLDLIRDILGTMYRVDPKKSETTETSAQPRRKHTLEKALGLLATGHPAPSDAEVERWLDGHRVEKYG